MCISGARAYAGFNSQVVEYNLFMKLKNDCEVGSFILSTYEIADNGQISDCFKGIHVQPQE